MSWWRDDDVFRARSADTFDPKATDGPSTQSTSAHLSEETEAGMWKRIPRGRDMLLSLHEPDINPSSNYIHVQNPLTDSFFSLHRRRLSRFLKGFSLICWIPFASWRLLFWQNTHQFVPSPYRQHFVEFATPPETPPLPSPEGIWWDVPHPSWRSFIW